MVNQPETRHIHAGRSSRGLLEPERVIREIGLKKGDTFLDAGCGNGRFSFITSDIIGSEGKIYAIDNDEATIITLKKEVDNKGISNIEALIADITARIPLGSKSIDVCLLANVLHGFVANKEVASSLQEITRVLKAGSTLAVVDHKKISHAPGPPLSIRMTPEEVVALIAPYGYQKKRVVEVGPYHYAVIFSKEQ